MPLGRCARHPRDINIDSLSKKESKFAFDLSENPYAGKQTHIKKKIPMQASNKLQNMVYGDELEPKEKSQCFYSHRLNRAIGGGKAKKKRR
jgi:hypothetical protein